MTSTSIISLLSLLALLVAVIFYVVFWPGLRRKRIEQRPFPPEWETILQENLPIYRGMSPDHRHQLQNLVKRFIADKKFIGCAGQQITDAIRITIAGNACLLLLNRNSGCYPQLDSVLVYPSTFLVSREERDEAGLVSVHHSELVGESWSQGKIILAWDDVERGVGNFRDGYNVVLHEFAHELDHEDGVTNGVPLLRTRGAYNSWAKVFAAEYAQLQASADRDEPTLLDHYGATDPAEFFAVATETFFEKPLQMQVHHGALFAELMNYYGVDPGQWVVDKP